MNCKQLKDLLSYFNDEDLVTLYILENGERYNLQLEDIDTGIEGVFEINVKEDLTKHLTR